MNAIKVLNIAWPLYETVTGWPRHREIGNLDAHFSRQGKHREFAKNIKNIILHREFTSTQGKF